MGEVVAESRVRAALAIYGRLIAGRIRSDWQYRTSFFLYLIGQAVASGLDLLAIAVIFGQVDSLADWSGVEVALLYGLAATSFGWADLFFSQVENAGQYIKAGTFDSFLIRPVSPLLQLMGVEFGLRRLGRVLQPVVTLTVALALVDADWRPTTAAIVPITVLSGTAIFASIFIITNSIAFWTVDSQEVANSFTYGGVTLAEYPIDLFAQWVRRLVVFVVPLAFIAYLPAAFILGKPPVDGLPRNLAWATPLVACAAVALARIVWAAALRTYRSTGS